MDEAIRLHLIIVFGALAITKYIELTSGLSIKKVLFAAEKVISHTVRNVITNETSVIQTSIQDPLLIEHINLLNSIGH